MPPNKTIFMLFMNRKTKNYKQREKTRDPLFKTVASPWADTKLYQTWKCLFFSWTGRNKININKEKQKMPRNSLFKAVAVPWSDTTCSQTTLIHLIYNRRRCSFLLFNLTKMIIKSISITHSLNFHCIIPNNKININHSPLWFWL